MQKGGCFSANSAKNRPLPRGGVWLRSPLKDFTPFFGVRISGAAQNASGFPFGFPFSPPRPPRPEPPPASKNGATHDAGLSGVPWVINAEIYPARVRAVAVGQATFFNWLANWLLGKGGIFGFVPAVSRPKNEWVRQTKRVVWIPSFR